MSIRFFISLLFLLLHFQLFAQEKKKFKDVVNVSGYLKYLPSINFADGNSMTDNLIHNRINIKGYLSNSFTLELGIRNRLFFGETVNSIPNYAQYVDRDNGEVDLSFLLLDKNSYVVHSMIDRAYLDFSKGKFEIRAGRQRINWGINLAWNSNDLFNAYNIIDFDYQERPGSDALRVQYYTGDVSKLEMAYKPGEDIDHTILGSLYKFNTQKYDIQLIAANYYTDVALGGGWAGNIKNAGFKGEATYFRTKSNFADTSGSLSLSSSADYSFKKGIYVNASFLLNSEGINSADSTSGTLFGTNQLTAKSLMPSKYSYFAQLSGAFYPQLNGSISIIYGQGMNILFFMPSLGYALHENWDISLTGQIFFGEEQNTFKNLGNSIFLRIQFSY